MASSHLDLSSAGKQSARLRRDLLKVSEAAGVLHPALLTPDDVAILDGDRRQASLREVYGYEPGWGAPGPEIAAEISRLMYPQHAAQDEEDVVQVEPVPLDDQPNQAVE